MENLNLIKIKLNFPRPTDDFPRLKFGKIWWVMVAFYFDFVITL